MRRTAKVALSALMIVLAASVSFALSNVIPGGAWPNTWPKELETLRNQSRIFNHDTGDTYEIPFTSRKQFESAWPHILKVKSNEAPLILLSSPDKKFGEPFKAGVRILSPLTGTLVTPKGTRYPPGAEAAIPGGKFLKIGPPWPDYIKSKSGALPEYVDYKDGKWVPYKETKPWDHYIRRARIDIELIVDGNIVDLNRIPLPPDTPIIDNRFKEEFRGQSTK